MGRGYGIRPFLAEREGAGNPEPFLSQRYSKNICRFWKWGKRKLDHFAVGEGGVLRFLLNAHVWISF